MEIKTLPKKVWKNFNKNRKGIWNRQTRPQNWNKLTDGIFAGCLVTFSNFPFKVINLFPHRLTSSLSLAQPTEPFVWLDASQDSTTGSSRIIASVWPGSSISWLSLTVVAQEPVDSSATDETSPSDGGVEIGIASLKIYGITTTNVAMNIDENISRSTWETRLQNNNNK